MLQSEGRDVLNVIEQLQNRLDMVEAHARANTTSIRAFNSSIKLSLRKQSEYIGQADFKV
jgi:hypothetical protein